MQKIMSNAVAAALVGAVVYLPTACSSRALPPAFPATSAASLEAPEGQAVSVTRALEQDPPLPGESVDHWPGLQTGKAPAAAHQHHRGAASHDPAPAQSAGPSPSPASGADSAPAEASYTCPMHPEVVSEQPGLCPKCNMKLVPKK